MSTIAYFPFESSQSENSLRRSEIVEETMLSIVKQFLLTKKRSRLGKNIGSSLPEMLYNLYNDDMLSSQSDLIKQELVEQFPEFEFHSLQMEIRHFEEGSITSNLIVTIVMSTLISDILEFQIIIPR